jgi:glycosyltransferase involved in cell wall biosynthesis
MASGESTSPAGLFKRMPDLNDQGAELGAARIVICIATYRRPSQLRSLLASLGDQVLADTPTNMKVMVVDNDINETARHTCEQAVSPWPIQYVVEPRRGISQARNAALRNSRDADWVAFVDDDEVVEPNWLDRLWHTQRKFQADIVTGPVVPQYQTGVPEWIIQSGILVRHRYRTGSRPKTPGTGNAFIRTEVFRRIGSFDERFGLTGGEDSDFFLRAGQAGFRLVWCDEAVVRESVGPRRAGLGYVLRREYRDASTLVRAEMSCHPGMLTCLGRSAKALARIAQGVLTLPWAAVRGLPATARALQRICLGAGILGGLLGFAVEPYRNPEREL